jgi:hypothetical protein
MGFFQTKNRRYWTNRWDNPKKISGNIDLLKVHQMVILNFYLKKSFSGHDLTSATVARK